MTSDPNQSREIRVGRACSACHRKKLKCDREPPPRGCNTCRKSGIPCVYTNRSGKDLGRSTTRAGRKKPRGPYQKVQTPKEKELEHCVKLLTEKCSDLEYQLQQIAPGSDSSKPEPRRSDDIHGIASTAENQSNGIISSCVLSLPSIHSYVHPEPADILELWSQYVFAVDPINKIIHCPTVAQIILSAKDQPASQPSEIEALMLSIYIASLNSLEASESQCRLLVEQKNLMATYRAVLDDRLLQADAEPNSVTLTLLQAGLIYLVSLRHQAGCDKSLNISNLFELIVRLAHHLHLHEPSAYSSLPPFEVEYRRRVWWIIRRYESAYAEDFGKCKGLFKGAEIPLPSNYNDTDLDPSMTTYPIPRDGLSEFSIVLIQVKVVELLCRLDKPVSHTTTANYLSMRQNSDALRRETCRLVDETKAEIEQDVLVKCDISRPFDWLILLMGKVILTKLEIMLLEPPPESSVNATRELCDTKVLLSLDIIECHQIITTDPSLQRWQWNWKHGHQWHSTIYVLEQVARRPDAGFAKRAWKVIDAVLTTPNILDKHGMNIETRTKLLNSHESALRAREQLLHDRSSAMPAGTAL